MEALIGTLLQYGTTPALIVLAALVGFLIRKIDDNGKKDEARSADMRKTFSDFTEKAEARFLEHEERMTCIEKEYTPITTHYKDIGGWKEDTNEMRLEIREEFRSVRTDINNLMSQLFKLIIEGVKHGD